MPSNFKSLILLAATLGLGFGLIEALEIVALRSTPWIQPMTKTSLDVTWVAPLVHVLLNVGAALVLWLVSRAGLPVPAVVPPALFAFSGALAVAMYSGVLGLYSSILLAAGVAVQAGRLLGGRTNVAMLRRSVASLAVVLAVVFAGLRTADAWSARDGGGPAPPPGTPNVLVVVMDTVRADRLSAYGYGKRTPTIDRIAAEGTLFERAISSSSWTLPSHASLLTGLAQTQHGAESVSTVLSSTHEQLQQRFRARGYRTGAFVANTIFFLPERGFSPGFQVFNVHYLRSLVARTTWGRFAKKVARAYLYAELDPFRSAATINAAFERWRDEAPDRPFFAVLNYMEAHEPYHPGVRPANLRVWDLRGGRSAADNAQLSKDYDDAIGLIDAELGRLVEGAIRERWWDNTVLVLLSDHGEAIADGSFDHGNDLTLEQIHVPLVFRLPGRIPAGVRVASPVSIVDIAATIAEFTGGSGDRPVPGRSLTRWFSATPAPVAAPVLAELVETNHEPSQRLRTVVMDGFQLIRNMETSEERLFAQSDVSGQENLIDRPEHAEVRARLREALDGTHAAP